MYGPAFIDCLARICFSIPPASLLLCSLASFAAVAAALAAAAAAGTAEAAAAFAFILLELFSSGASGKFSDSFNRRAIR